MDIRRYSDRWLWLLSIAICLGPLWLVRHDMWDSVVGTYSMATGDFRGVKAWITDANWFLLDWLYQALGFICSATGLPSWISVKTFISLFIVLIAVEAAKFAKGALRLPDDVVKWVGPLVLVFPVWANLYSSVFIYVVFIWATLAGHRMLHERGRITHPLLYKVIAWSLVVIGFQVNSNLVLILALEFARWLVRDKRIPWKWERVWGLLAACVLTYAFLRISFPPRGVYAGIYNNFLLPTSRANIVALASAVVMYGTWLALVAPPLLIAWWLSRRKRAGHEAVGVFNDVSSGAMWFAVLSLTFAAAFPYIAVGKAPILFFYNPFSVLVTASSPVSFAGSHDFFFLADSWSNRHLFVAVFPLALLIATAVAILAARTRLENRRAVLGSLCIAWCLLAGCLLYTHHLKLKRLALEQSLLNYLKQEKEPAPGKVDFIISPANRWLYAPGESNYWLWLAYGKTVWASAAYYENGVSMAMSTSLRDNAIRDLPSDPLAYLPHSMMTDFVPTGLCTTYRVNMISPKNYAALLASGHFPNFAPVATVEKDSEHCR